MPTLSDFERVRVIVFGDLPGARYRAGRTVRILKRHFPRVADATVLSASRFAKFIEEEESPLWLIRAGAIPRGAAHWFLPPSNGKPLCAFGLVGNCPTQHTPRANELLREAWRNESAQCARDAAEWSGLQERTGGDFCTLERLHEKLPRIASVFLDPSGAPGFSNCVADSSSTDAAVRAWLATTTARCVRLPHLDVFDDSALRVAQVVTSLQRGGAERIALDLTRELPRCGVRPLLFALGTPMRAAFVTPTEIVDFLPGRNRAEHVRNVGERAIALGCDAVHAHLLSADDMAIVADSGLPVVATVHNVKQGWPAGFEGQGSGVRSQGSGFRVALLAACSRAVERDLLDANLGAPVRTVWNGIDVGAFQPSAKNCEDALALRRQLELAPSDFVLISLANPRPQKRLERVPAVLAALQHELSVRGIARGVKWIVAGEASRSSEEALRCDVALRAEIQRLNLGDAVRFVGAAENVAVLLSAGDALVSVSAWEGLSLAHLEALAAGVPVVSTAAGGTAEIVAENPNMSVVPLDAPPEIIASKLADVAEGANVRDRLEPASHSASATSSARRPSSGEREEQNVSTFKRSSFTLHTMTARYASLYPRAIEAARGARMGDGIWLIANNFTTGGAQSSARRLLLGLKAQGVAVRAAVLQEREDNPTPGLSALRAAGVPVFAAEPRALDPLDAVTQIIERIDADPPRAILFWNAITEHKILLADALWDIPIFDVSPGEMLFDALDKYFAAPRPGLPYRSAPDYGARLAGVVVKYAGEAARAEASLKTQTHVIPNGLGATASNQLVGSPRSDLLVIGTSARISPQKKLDDLLEALRLAAPQLPPHVLRIAGRAEAGAEEHAQQLKELSAGLSVEWCSEFQDSRSFLSGLDIFAMISEPAGCPNASLEAMAVGLPVVATDYGGASEQIVDGATGRLVPRGDARAFAAALVELARDAEKRAAFGAAGRARVEAHFSIERMIDDYRRLCGV